MSVERTTGPRHEQLIKRLDTFVKEVEEWLEPGPNRDDVIDRLQVVQSALLHCREAYHRDPS